MSDGTPPPEGLLLGQDLYVKTTAQEPVAGRPSTLHSPEEKQHEEEKVEMVGEMSVSKEKKNTEIRSQREYSLQPSRCSHS